MILTKKGRTPCSCEPGEVLAQITALLAGRAVERIVFNEITCGAASNFEKTTELARKMVTEFGMSDKPGPPALVTRQGHSIPGQDLVERRH